MHAFFRRKNSLCLFKNVFNYAHPSNTNLSSGTHEGVKFVNYFRFRHQFANMDKTKFFLIVVNQIHTFIRSFYQISMCIVII